MLATKQRGGGDHRDLLAVHGDDEGGAQRNLGLAEADIAAHQPVHGPARAKVAQDLLDRLGLVVGLGIGKARGKFIIDAGGRQHGIGGSGRPHRGRAHQLLGDVLQALLDSCLARLPLHAAQPVELDGRILRAVARQHFDVLDGHIELVVALVDHLQAVMGSAANIEGLEPFVAPDAMIGMDDEIALGEGRQFGQETIRLGSPFGRAGHAVAQNIGFGNDGEIAGNEPMVQSEEDEAHHVGRQSPDGGPVRGLIAPGEAMIGHDMFQPIAAALADGRDQHAMASGLFLGDAIADRVIEIDLRSRPGLGEILPAPAAGIGLALGRGKGRERQHGARTQAFVELATPEIEGIGRQRAIDSRSLALAPAHHLRTRLIEIGNGIEPRLDRFIGLMIQAHDGTGQVIQQ